MSNNNIISEIIGAETIDKSEQNLGVCWIERTIKLETKERKAFHTSARELIPVTGQSAIPELLAGLIDEAKEFVCLSSFLIQKSAVSDALLRASERGVRAYLLTAGEDELRMATEDLDDITKERAENLKDLLDAFAGKVLVRTAGHFHAKFMLIDPKLDTCKGIMMTCNATVDAMSGKNIEVVATLQTSEVRSYYSQFLKGFWIEARHELLAKSELKEITELERLNPKEIRASTHYHTCGKECTLRDRIIELINDAKSSIVITSWTFEQSSAVIQALMNSLNRRVLVTVHARISHTNTVVLKELARAGATVIGNERYHAKILVVDEQTGLISSANISKKGLEEGFEVSIELKGDEVKTLSEVVQLFGDRCTWELKNDLKLGMAKNNVLQLVEGSKELKKIQIIERHATSIKKYNVKSCEHMRSRPPNLESWRVNPDGVLYKKIIYNYSIEPPKLPRDAMPEKGGSAQAYRSKDGKSRYVVVSSWTEVDQFIDFARKINASLVVKA